MSSKCFAKGKSTSNRSKKPQAKVRAHRFFFIPLRTIVFRSISFSPLSCQSFGSRSSNFSRRSAACMHMCAASVGRHDIRTRVRLINHHSPRQRQISLFLARETVCPRGVALSAPPLSTPTTRSAAINSAGALRGGKRQRQMARTKTDYFVISRSRGSSPNEQNVSISF